MTVLWSMVKQKKKEEHLTGLHNHSVEWYAVFTSTILTALFIGVTGLLTATLIMTPFGSRYHVDVEEALSSVLLRGPPG